MTTKKRSNKFKDYKNTELLSKYITAQGKILSRRVTRLSAKEHRDLTKSIKQARILGFLFFNLQKSNI